LLHCFIDSLNPWFIASFTELCMDSFISWSSQQPIAHSLMNLDAPHNFNNSWFLHRKNFPTSNWFLTTISFFRNFRLSAGRALPGSVWTTQQMSCISSRAEVNQPLLVLLAFAGWSAHHGWVRRLHASTKLVQIQGNVFFFHPVTQIVRCNSRSFWKTVLDFLLPTTCFSKTCDAHDVNAGTLNSTWPCRKHSQRTGSPVVFWCHNWRDKTLTLHWLCKLTQPEQPKSSG
jgi:hypothetical protein